jgi:hypothetical protein
LPNQDFSASTTLRQSLPQEWAGKVPRLEADEVTSLSRELGVDLALAEIATVITRGYTEEFGMSFAERDALPDEMRGEIQRLAQSIFAPDNWISRCASPHLDHHGVRDGLLGSFEAYFSLAPGPTLDDALLSGDIIANPEGIEDLERRLKGCLVDRVAIDAIVSEVLAQPHNFVLGLSPDFISRSDYLCWARVTPTGCTDEGCR